MNNLYLKNVQDYKISSHYLTTDPGVEKFLISLGGMSISVHKSYEDAAKTVIKLAKDPWYYDRKQNQ